MPSQSRLISMGNPLKTIAQMPIIILDATFRTESKRHFDGGGNFTYKPVYDLTRGKTLSSCYKSKYTLNYTVKL